VLQEGTFERVGSNRTVHATCVLLLRPHRDLEALIAEGKFREDLFYRLNVFPIVLPPLRDRIEDMPVLIHHLLERNARIAARIELTPAAVAALSRCPVGGQREGTLEPARTACASASGARGWTSSNCPTVYRPAGSAPTVRERQPSMLLATQPAQPEALPRDGLDLRDHLSGIESQSIRRALMEAGGTVAEAARLLKMQRRRWSRSSRSIN